MKNKNLLIGILLAALACALAVAGWTLLPDTLAVQITAAGQTGNTLPKFAALGLPTLLAVIFSFLYAKNGNTKNLAVAVVGVALLVLTFVFNL
ncbi:MAG: hypothetical protein VB092_08925 [Oscillospiraceae bacterium]|nr:hypothetical protein [Oscillospiraceae bacterium]